MKRYVLHRELLIPRDLPEVFGFFSNPGNLSLITPPSLGFRILTPSPIEMRPGVVIDYTIRLLGFRLRWKTLISEYEPPFRFVDVQVNGPYAYWEHTHLFRVVEGGTLMTDDVEYALPFGPLGQLINVLFVQEQLRKIFDYRASVLANVFTRTQSRDKPPATGSTS